MTTRIVRVACVVTAVTASVGLAACDPWLPPASFTVTSTAAGADADPGDGVCEATVAAGDCTLPAAVDEGNALGAATIAVPPGSYPGGSISVTGNLSIVGDGTGPVLLNHTSTVEPGAHLVVDGVSSYGVPGARFVVAGTFVGRHLNLTGLESLGVVEVEAGGSAVIENSLLVRVFGNRASIRNAGTLVLRGSAVKSWVSFGVNTAAVSSSGTVVAMGSSLQSCTGTPPQSLGYNNDDDGSCGLDAVGDVPSSPPDISIQVGSVVDYELNPGSPLIDAIPSGAIGCGDSLVDDLVGTSRPQDGDGDGVAACDIGARELAAGP